MKGKVYLVGAGPGDPGLLTLKGQSALESADCVIYDFLANQELLHFAPPECERICVGKRAGHPTISQDGINRLLIRKARAGRRVVRLKGGDPFIFGRGGEEAQALVKAGIPFEVVPGVTAGYAAPAYAGIPVTYRDIASSVAFITGHAGGSPKARSTTDWSRLAGGADTLVLFMGVRNLPDITRALIQHGRDPQTPAAVIQWGTRARQQVIEGTLSSVAARAKNIEPPAVTIVGDVVRLRRELNWFEQLPLSGKRIVITRARDQAGDLCRRLEQLGAEVVEIPVIAIRPPRSWKPLDRAIGRLEEFDYLLFTSANGVKNFLERLDACGRDTRDLKGLKIGAIGSATAGELKKTGIKVDFVPCEYRAEGLLEALSAENVSGKSFLIPRAKEARDVLPRVLRQRGALVEVVETYQTVPARSSSRQIEQQLNPPPDAILFTSSSTVTNFLKLLPARRRRSRLNRVALASIGPITSGTIRKAGLQVTIEAAESTMAGLVKALQDHFSS